MVIVFVEHVLNEEGRRYFSTWIEEIAEVLREFDGFISIRELNDADHPDRCLLLLRFESMDLLQTWADSNAHDRMIDRLAPYQTRKQRSEIFRAAPKHE